MTDITDEQLDELEAKAERSNRVGWLAEGLMAMHVLELIQALRKARAQPDQSNAMVEDCLYRIDKLNEDKKVMMEAYEQALFWLGSAIQYIPQSVDLQEHSKVHEALKDVINKRPGDYEYK